MCLRRNKGSSTFGVAALLGVLRALVACVSLAAALGHAQGFISPAQPPPPEDDPGRFEIRSASAELKDGVYYLNARIDYRLSSEARMALQSGLPLTIRLDLELLKGRRFWFDADDASLRQRYQLEYHALSERFLVTNLNSGDQASFATLFAALASLGRVEDLPVIDATLLEPDHAYDLRLRAVLDVEQFPGPLRLLAFWRRDFSLGSDWYRWTLQNH
ncbi:MAG TPA: DUF4390 domain-containing protein [Burkholderiales bacterium]|nr:DUF4390 domain-containing protein [Burkholderiales bacterium]